MIYTITAVSADLQIHPRCVGYFLNENDARKAVLSNSHLYEAGYYPYIVIENISPGIYSNINSGEVWFKFNNDIESYAEIVKPYSYKNIIAFAMG